jgi:hypothetical protein
MQGLDKFREYMSGFRSHYVVIGGLATVLTLEDRGLPARATKDVDMIREGWIRSKSFKNIQEEEGGKMLLLSLNT